MEITKCCKNPACVQKKLQETRCSDIQGNQEFVKKFQEKGTVADRDWCGPSKLVRTPQNIEKSGKKARFSTAIVKNTVELAQNLKK